MKDIKIKDVGEFCDFLKSITQISFAQEFIIDSEGCRVKSVNDFSTIRAYISTNTLTSEEEVTFCLGETFKLAKALTKIYEFNGKKLVDQTLSYDGTYVYYNSNGYKFKFATIKRKAIERNLTDDITTTLEYDYGLVLDSATFKNILTTSSIAAKEGTKVYFYREGENILVDIDDKVDVSSDSISLPVSKDFDGEWVKPLCTKLEIFRLFNVIDADSIKIYSTVQKTLTIESTKNNLTLKIVTGLVKR
jgi:hypothetical protein